MRVMDRLPVRVGRNDHGAGDLVLPALLLLVPQHPEVAEAQRDGREVLADLAQESASVADRAALPEVVDPDAERLLAERLAGRAALEIREVRQRDERRQQLVERAV